MNCINNRKLGIDIIKTVAVIFVMNVHFFLNTSFYTTAITDKNMFFQSVIRWIFLSCVPLFLLATGFLMYKKTASKQYFLKLVHIFASYVVISIICLIFNTFYLHTHYTFYSAIFSIFNFSADTYSWYLNMYLRLYLIIPFINIVLNSIDKKAYHILISILLLLIAIPAAINPILTCKPFLSIVYFPDWWQSFYPIIYYIIGAYIGKYQPKVNRKLCIAVVLFIAIMQTFILIWARKPQVNNWFLSNYSSLFIIAQSTAIFLALYDVDCKLPITQNLFKMISTSTLEIFLLSYLVDHVLYNKSTPIFNFHLSQQQMFRNYYLIAVPICMVCDILIAVIYRFLYDRIIILISTRKVNILCIIKAVTIHAR
ncbi:MAG TPA: acyltransferase family protein [Oscillospiraceae bacterium]|nr:acyltransferase family protein [Oscillospiraceae bacterium]